MKRIHLLQIQGILPNPVRANASTCGSMHARRSCLPYTDSQNHQHTGWTISRPRVASRLPRDGSLLENFSKVRLDKIIDTSIDICVSMTRKFRRGYVCWNIQVKIRSWHPVQVPIYRKYRIFLTKGMRESSGQNSRRRRAKMPGGRRCTLRGVCKYAPSTSSCSHYSPRIYQHPTRTGRIQGRRSQLHLDDQSSP